MSYVSQCLADGAITLLELAESTVTNGSTATDQAGIQNGTFGGTGWTGGLTGLRGAGGLTAASNNTSSLINVPVVGGNSTADTFTYEMWVKLAGYPASTGGLAGVGTTLIRFNSSGQFRLTKQSVADIVSSSASIPIDTSFHHVIIQKNGASSAKCFLDGADVSSFIGNQTMDAASGNYTFARNGTDAATAGTWAMCALYPTALSNAQIQNHYTLGNGVLNKGLALMGVGS